MIAGGTPCFALPSLSHLNMFIITISASKSTAKSAFAETGLAILAKSLLPETIAFCPPTFTPKGRTLESVDCADSFGCSVSFFSVLVAF